MTALKLKNLLLIILLFFISCNKREGIVPILFTGEVTDITKDGAVFSGSFRNIDSDELIEYGFIWGNDPTPDINNSLRYSFTVVPSDGIVEYKNVASLESSKDYYLRTYVICKTGTYYGNIVSFFSLGSKAPVLTDVIPSSANFGDTIILLAENIGFDTSMIKIKFGADPSKIIKSNDTAIYVVVPFLKVNSPFYSNGKIDITVSKYNNSNTLKDKFNILPPIITSLSTNIGRSYDEFTIHGKGFHPFLTKIYIGEYLCNKISVTENTIIANLPALFNDYDGQIKLEIVNLETQGEKVSVLAPKIVKTFPDKVFSNESLFLVGRHLLNSNLSIELNGQPTSIIKSTDDTIEIKVPEAMCGKELSLGLKVGDVSSIYESGISFKQPTNIQITTIPNNLFDGIITIAADYVPNIQLSTLPLADLNGTIVTTYITKLNSVRSKITLYPNTDVKPLDGWLNGKISFCETSELKIDSLFEIPPPQITEVPLTLYCYSTFSIKGKYFNPDSRKNQILLNDKAIGISYYQNMNSELLWSDLIPLSQAEGNYQLKVVTNGQVSNIKNVNVVQRWHRVTSLPESMEYNAIVFMTKDNIYAGGGIYYLHSKNFYSYNLTSNTWQQIAELPIRSGISVNDENYGYAIGDSIYRYSFKDNTWQFITSLRGVQCTTAFLYQNKIFIYGGPTVDTHYYFDLTTNQWIGYPGSSESSRGYDQQGSVVNGDKAYIFNGYEKYCLDLNTLSLKLVYDGWNYLNTTWASLQGFTYNNEAYFFDTRCSIFNLNDLNKWRSLECPISSYHSHVFRIDNIAYFINSDEIWTLNLDL